MTLRPTVFDRHVLTFDVTGLGQPAVKCSDPLTSRVARCIVEETDHRHLRLLCACCHRPRQHRAANQRDEVAASDLRGHSITSSARASSVGGTVRPSDLAVLRLITSSNLVGCTTGRSAGFSPLRMRPTYTPAWRYIS